VERAILGLRSDHEAIVVAIRVLDRLSATARKGLPIVLADLSALLAYLDEFVDRCHVGKEEGYLMPALAEFPEAASQIPIAELLAEHDHGRRVVKELIAARTLISTRSAFFGWPPNTWISPGTTSRRRTACFSPRAPPSLRGEARDPLRSLRRARGESDRAAPPRRAAPIARDLEKEISRGLLARLLLFEPR